MPGVKHKSPNPVETKAGRSPKSRVAVNVMERHFLSQAARHLTEYCVGNPAYTVKLRETKAGRVKFTFPGSKQEEFALRRAYLDADGAAQASSARFVPWGQIPAQRILIQTYKELFGPQQPMPWSLTRIPAYGKLPHFDADEQEIDEGRDAYDLAAEQGRYQSSYWRMRAALRTSEGEPVSETRSGLHYAAELAVGLTMLSEPKEYSAAHPDPEMRRLIAEVFLPDVVLDI